MSSSADFEPIASWEKHTKGIGSKLLQKFGFKGRLGAKEDGINKAIEVSVRPTNVGLGFGSSSNGDEHSHNHRDRDRDRDTSKKGKKTVRIMEDSNSNSHSNSNSEEALQEKKRRKLASESFLKDYEQFMGDLDASKKSMVGQIIDMRQQDVKVISNLKELNSYSSDGTSVPVNTTERPTYGKELLYNLAKALNVHNKRLNDETNAKNRYEQQLEELRAQQHAERSRLERLEILKEALLRIHYSVENDFSDSHTATIMQREKLLESILSQCKDLYVNNPQEFVSLGFSKLLLNILEKVLVPLKDSILEEQATLKLILSHWNDLIKFFEDKGIRSVAGECVSALQFVAEREFLPIVRRFITSHWDPVRQCSKGVDIMETMKEVLPIRVIQETVDVVLLPRLSSSLQSWNNDAKHPLHSWLIPWLPLMTSKLSALYPEVRRKLIGFFKAWHANDTTVIDVLTPWLSVFDSGSMENFLSKVIVPKLVEYVKRNLVINPADQSLDTIEMLLQWEAVLPAHQLSCVFAGEVFPKWLGALIAWLNAPNCNFEEICLWYEGWKSVFPATVLNDEENVLPILNFALDVMKESVKKRKDPSAVHVDLVTVHRTALNSIERTDYYTLIKKYLVDAKFKEKVQSINQTQAASFTTSLRDVMEMIAEKNGLDFKPKFGRMVEGKQVWEFGKTSCYIENSVIYTMKPGGQWQPISLDSLVIQSK